MFLTFEGVDCSGKTTQATIVVDELRALGVRAIRFIREPGGTVISERLREILLDGRNLELTGLAELFLFSASRAQLVHEVILPALRRGEIVVCDRFYDSTTAYQAYGRGLSLEGVRKINAMATSGIEPDLTLLVDITVEEIERRMKAAGVALDRLENSGRAFYERVRNGYLAIAQENPERVVVIDGMRNKEIIAREILRTVQERQQRIHSCGRGRP